jgi:hypothetical protein
MCMAITLSRDLAPTYTPKAIPQRRMAPTHLGLEVMQRAHKSIATRMLERML